MVGNPVDRLALVLADRYTIEHELAAGGMATVYLARVFPGVETPARLRRVNAPRLVLKDAHRVASFRTRPEGAEPGFHAKRTGAADVEWKGRQPREPRR